MYHISTLSLLGKISQTEKIIDLSIGIVAVLAAAIMG
jgi:hypothetical protein